MATDRELALTVLNKHIGDSSSGLNHCEFISGKTNTSSIYIIASFWKNILENLRLSAGELHVGLYVFHF